MLRIAPNRGEQKSGYYLLYDLYIKAQRATLIFLLIIDFAFSHALHREPWIFRYAADV